MATIESNNRRDDDSALHPAALGLSPNDPNYLKALAAHVQQAASQVEPVRNEPSSELIPPHALNNPAIQSKVAAPRPLGSRSVASEIPRIPVTMPTVSAISPLGESSTFMPRPLGTPAVINELRKVRAEHPTGFGHKLLKGLKEAGLGALAGGEALGESMFPTVAARIPGSMTRTDLENARTERENELGAENATKQQDELEREQEAEYRAELGEGRNREQARHNAEMEMVAIDKLNRPAKAGLTQIKVPPELLAQYPEPNPANYAGGVSSPKYQQDEKTWGQNVEKAEQQEYAGKHPQRSQTPAEASRADAALRAKKSDLDKTKAAAYTKLESEISDASASGHPMSPAEILNRKQAIENDYANEISDLTGQRISPYEYNRQAPASALPKAPKPGTRLSDQQIWNQFLQASGGDANKAEQLARQNGWQ